MTKSLQEQYAPTSACFGCGPANPHGLRIRSFQEGDETVCTWTASTMHEAFPGMLNGGIVGALLDCHCNWTAAVFLMRQQGLAAPQCTVTAEYSIKLRRPTPTNGPITLRAKVVESGPDRARVAGTLEAGGKICASCDGLFVQVREGHPAFHRW